MIADLLYTKLVAISGVSNRVSPDIRRGSHDQLPCVVYEIEGDDRLDILNPSLEFARASCTVHCLAETLAAATTLAETVITGLHGVQWTSGTSKALATRVLSMSTGTLDDSEAGGIDLTRSASLRLDILHSF